MECEKIKYFHDGDQLIAFNVRTLKVFRFKSELKRLLPVLLPERYTPEQKKSYLKMTDTIENDGFREYMRFLAYDEPNDGSVAGIDTLTISFPTVHKCNLQCRYCYADSGENFTDNTKFMSESVIDDILRFSLTKLAPECQFIQIGLAVIYKLNIFILPEILGKALTLFRIPHKRKSHCKMNVAVRDTCKG